jgi:erythromycin esterase-like protein
MKVMRKNQGYVAVCINLQRHRRTRCIIKLHALQNITTSKKLGMRNMPSSRKASFNKKMRAMKENLMATLILGEDMGMG